MKTLIKRTIIGVFIGIVAIIVSGYIVLDIAFSDMCRNKIIFELMSPDKKHKAIIFQRDCGATTGFSTHVSVIKSNEELPNESGNILISDGQPKDNAYKIKWLNSEKLLIVNTHKNRTHFKAETIENISISYE